MSVCEKCWSDAGGNYERYLELLKEREANPCTPEQQAGARAQHEADVNDALEDKARG